MKDNITYGSMFCVWNNPTKTIKYKYNEDGTICINEKGEKVILSEEPTFLNGLSEEEICNKVLGIWTNSKEGRTGAVAYCISAKGLHHLHLVLECPENQRFKFSTLKKLFPTIHMEPTRGSKKDAEDYINKKGKFEEKGEKVVCIKQEGEIKGSQGNRSDLDGLMQLIEEGKTPREIMELDLKNVKYESMLKKAFFVNRMKNAPLIRDVRVYWHWGLSGSGKSHSLIDICEQNGRDNVYMVSHTENGFLDNYNAEKVLFIDEFKGNIKFGELLVLLDKYLAQVHARYTDVYTLWNEVHITSIYTPDEVYSKLVEEKGIDTVKQLLRRITYMVYHYQENGEYKQFSQLSSDYISRKATISTIEFGEILPITRIE